MFRLIPVIISCILTAAHFMRANQAGWLLLYASAPLLLLLKRRWAAYIMSMLLIYGSYVWVHTARIIWKVRAMQGLPKNRMVMILGGVAAFTALSALIFLTKRLRERYAVSNRSSLPAMAAFLLTAVSLIIVRLKTPFPVILFDRFLPLGGWFEIFWLSVYSAFLAEKLHDPKLSKKWRPRIWGGFSLLFFTQLIIGLLGQTKFLMTGQLHLPVPALIFAGPIYRGGGLFMLILFGVTVLLVGPAWCSWLCYIGSWDDGASRLAKKRGKLPYFRRYMRVGIFALVILAAFVMRKTGVPVNIAVYSAATFGIVGVLVMLLWSSRAGVMAHCTSYCPIGLASTFFGKVNPFRIRIGDGCNACGACGKVCRYDALLANNISAGKVGGSCTLCGDCISVCRDNCIDYRFLKLSPETARTVFIVIIVSLHAIFLGVARL